MNRTFGLWLSKGWRRANRLRCLVMYHAPEVTSRVSYKTSVELAFGKFRIREPLPSCPEVPPSGLDLVLVPGVAFDLRGHRLGRGRGFYDRLLAGIRGIKCGVAFDEQIVAEVPSAEYDVRMDVILTPTQWVNMGD